jgi:taurine--2-oxoglutarate transaminase
MRTKYACVGDVRYKGLFSVLELVRDKQSKEPLAPYAGTSAEMAAFATYLRSKHVHTYLRFNLCMIAPPLVISQDELDYGLDIVEEGLARIDQTLTEGEGQR